ncbi:T9SS type A sorting domain-containing protein [Winogradskyella thalassocola]|uniref:Por secretion system C-terminal sorting domain-containing protein n=1 Tax=Winogradskyella thalassocola TaxID=262004 RepID=A0A1G8HPJ9_9FLAO|nr:T9SS type A sorting domain-containing protein [Winogradskyella thalassocola]SDI08411.1 Por secretion system C-terminal sorting domain-containing protein [Winogradskyella thalassocola]
MRRILILLIISIGMAANGWSQITEAEYFIDTDPGISNATNLTITSGNTINSSFSIPTLGLSNGLHVLHIRVKGTNDVWSLYYRDYFYIHTIEIPSAGSNLSTAEYFIDTDPGVGNGTTLSIASGQMLTDTFSISTAGLDNGLHVLHIRVKDLDDTWSLFYRDYFYIHTIDNVVSTPITAAEYFFDTDPGVGNGFSIPITEGFTVDETLAIPVPMDMTDGNHYLYLRVKNMDDIWSTYIFALFNVDSSLSVEEIDYNFFKVFPNPTNTLLNIQTYTDLDYSLQLFDVNGKKLIDNKTNSTIHTLNFSNYPKGVYLLHITEENTNKQSVVKIIKS